MLASISPVGEAARGQRWPVTVGAYLLASAIGGATLGALAGTLGWGLVTSVGQPPTGAVVAVLAVLAVLAVAIDRGVVRVTLPAWQRQVDETWLTRFRGWVYGAGFGFQLGAGLLTRIPTAAVHLAVAAAVAAGAVAQGAAAGLARGALVGVAFGTVRALPILLAGRHRDPGRLNAFHQRMDAAASTADRVTSAVVALAAAVLVTATVAG